MIRCEMEHVETTGCIILVLFPMEMPLIANLEVRSLVMNINHSCSFRQLKTISSVKFSYL
jgi:hypothetical protein